MVHATLARILKAQEDGDGLSEGAYSDALRQIRDAGRKTSCWIWWVFPTMPQLRPATSRPQFLLPDLDAVHEYITHPVLCARLLEMTEAMCAQLEAGVPPVVLLGSSVDEEKFRESVTLFALVAAAAHWGAVTGVVQPTAAAGGPAAAAGPASVDMATCFASVAQLSCRALAATRQHTLCEKTVRTLTSAAVGLDERWRCTLNPLELLQLSGCVVPLSGAEVAAESASPRESQCAPATAGKRGRQEMSGTTVEEVEAQLAGVDELSLADGDLDLVLPSDGFETLRPTETSSGVD
eukprot:COSAG02_NODE_4121_length_5748_cov_4.624358_4_plen_294_part_00